MVILASILAIWSAWVISGWYMRANSKSLFPRLTHKERVKLKREAKFVSEGDSRVSIAQFRNKRA